MDPEIILLTSDLHEIGTAVINVDFDVGYGDQIQNDFEVIATGLDAGGLYIPGTEWGGLIEFEKASNTSDQVTYKGWTWRGLLTQSIIIPPSGSDYKVVSGEANEVIASMLSGVLGDIFTVPETDSGLTIDDYQFKLYETLHDGLVEMLQSYGYKLHIHAEKVSAGSPIAIYVEAVPAVTISGTYNADSPVKMTFTSNRMGINHLVCMGQGELQNRQRVDLYVGQNGSISTTQYFTGFDERIAYLNYSFAESLSELRSAGKKKLKELASCKSIEVTVDASTELSVGDIVTGSYDSITVEAPIIEKIYTIDQGIPKAEYRVKEET